MPTDSAFWYRYIIVEPQGLTFRVYLHRRFVELSLWGVYALDTQAAMAQHGSHDRARGRNSWMHQNDSARSTGRAQAAPCT